jgi:PAB1-binding protein PBP1
MDSNKADENENLIDNGGRRKDSERRNFEYTVHIPERRSGKDRRDGKERRERRRAPDEAEKHTEEKGDEID